jgi:hypothetical protein
MALQPPDHQKLSGIVFNEPLSSETEAKRRNLLFTACFSILLAVYGLKVTKTPWLDFDVPEGAPDVLRGALSVALLYTFVVFSLHAFADVRRWLAAGDLMNLHSYFDISLKAYNHLNAISQWLEKPLPAEPQKRAAVQRVFSSSNEFLTELAAALTTARSSHRKLTYLQWGRLTFLDLGIPLALGVFAMFKIGGALPPFLEVVAK